MDHSEKIAETIFSNTHFMIAYMDKDFNFIRVNKAYADAGDQNTEFFEGKPHFKLYPNPENEKIFKNVVETGEPYNTIAKAMNQAFMGLSIIFLIGAILSFFIRGDKR